MRLKKTQIFSIWAAEGKDFDMDCLGKYNVLSRLKNKTEAAQFQSTALQIMSISREQSSNEITKSILVPENKPS